MTKGTTDPNTQATQPAQALVSKFMLKIIRLKYVSTLVCPTKLKSQQDDCAKLMHISSIDIHVVTHIRVKLG